MTLDGKVHGDLSSVMIDNFDVIEGSFTNDPNGLYLLVDSKNRINADVLKAIGYI